MSPVAHNMITHIEATKILSTPSQASFQYKINMYKSVLFLYTNNNPEQNEQTIPFTILTERKIKHSVINLIEEVKDLLNKL